MRDTERGHLVFGSFFSGIGLLDYGLHLAGIEHAWFCEADSWRREILERRWPGRPVYPDIRGVGADTAVRVDGIVGGFPCKGASTVGLRNGFDHAETVLWREMARAIRELRPRYVVVENVANILALHDGAIWGEVLGGLAALGFDVEWDCLPAAAVGAPHLRDRVFAVATYAAGEPERAPHDQAHAVAGGRDARALPRLGGAEPAPDADRDGVRQQPEPEPRSGRATVAGRPDEAAADPPGGPAGRIPADAARRLAAEPDGSHGVGVEWGQYEPAIRRWEAIYGPAPEPLVRRVDDRDAARVERSRLSALGDGVQVQLGQIVGAYIVEREGRLAA